MCYFSNKLWGGFCYNYIFNETVITTMMMISTSNRRTVMDVLCTIMSGTTQRLLIPINLFIIIIIYKLYKYYNI
jgi:hypothetical protein